MPQKASMLLKNTVTTCTAVLENVDSTSIEAKL
jgi:hypothetical protein